MSEVIFINTINNTDKTVTFKDNNSDWGDVDGVPDKLTIYLRGEDKDTHVVKKEVTDTPSIALFQGVGLTYTYLQLFAVDPPTDNFYKTEIIANEALPTQMLCVPMAMGFTYEVANQIYNAILGVHVPVTDLYESLTLGMMPQILELLNILSTEAVYTYDRENKWRKLYNHLITVVNDLNY